MTPGELRSLIEKRILVQFGPSPDNPLALNLSPMFGPYLCARLNLGGAQLLVMDELGEEFVLATLHEGRWRVNDGLDEGGKTYECVTFLSHNTIDRPESQK